jgi:phage/plasmid-associated DNA primase
MSFPFHRNFKLHPNVFKHSIYPANAVLNEYIDIKYLYSIIQNSENVEFSNNHPQHKLYKSVKDQLIKYASLYDEKAKCFKVAISLPSHGWGRQNPEKQLGLSVFHRPHRHSLATKLYDDYDLVNAQPEIYNQILLQNGQSFNCLSYYCENRDEILDEITVHYNNKINNEIVKKIIIALMNGADIAYQFQKYNIETCDNHHPFLLQFSQEIMPVVDLIYHHNSHIADDVVSANPERFQTTGDALLAERKKTVAGLFYQTVERFIQEKCISFLIINKGFILLDDIVPSQDGFMIKKHLTYPEIVNDLEYIINYTMGFPIKIKNKPFKEAFPFQLLSNAEVDVLKQKYKTDQQRLEFFIDATKLTNPYDTAIVICSTLSDTLKLCKEEWYMLTANQLWLHQREPSFYVIAELRKYIDKSNKKIVYQIEKTNDETEKKKLIDLSEKYLKAYKSTVSSSFLNTLIKCLKTLLVDNTFANKLDNNPHQLAFKNGIVDLKTKEFRKGIVSGDFLTQTIPYDYTVGDLIKKNFVKSVLLKILNNNREHLEYFLSIIGMCFIGNPSLEKSAYFCVDNTTKSSGDNGKTFFFDILSHLFPNYVYKTQGSFLDVKHTKVHKQLAMMKGKRIVWLDEFGTTQTNSELLKQIADGLKIESEVMYGTSDVINIMFKLFALTNIKPVIDAKEEAVYNRYKQMSYGSHFDRTGTRTIENPDKLEFIADTSLSGLIKTQYVNEVFELIIEYANKYYENKIPDVPKQFLDDTKETKKNNDPFMTWFEDKCEIDDNGKIALGLLINEYNMKDKIIKDGMKRMGFKYDKDLRSIGKDSNGNHYKGGFSGVKLKEEEKEEEHNN